MHRLILGLLKEIRALPVIATLTALYFAFSLANVPITSQILLYFVGVFFLLYTVHFLDTYEDEFITKEDSYKTFLFAHGSSGLLKKEELITGAAVSSMSFFVILSCLSFSAGLMFFMINFFAYLIGISYSKYLSKNLFSSLLSYSTGLVLCMFAMYLLASGKFDLKILVYSIPIFLLFTGSKTSMDIADLETDKKTKKPNIGLAIGTSNAKKLVLIMLILGLLLTLNYSISVINIILVLLFLLFFYYCISLKPEKSTSFVTAGVFLFLVFQILLYLLTR